ncbi:uncharacterized protein N7469_011664 [Penicillium citrinum]|uniref:Uncharacterized protein n=1 Tax=Penicillium citrinum TaxID=5077 RepID=A0A9W9N8E8_PENCI|nr:uncharacterized protein N7469_011664 [Penicillium citrinum]KAJ5215173.1 hypothetical protein N7469_011664 [Penicillium citrinum]
MPFEFVMNDGIDNATRKRIRRHVSLGRNMGRKLTRASKKDLALMTATSFRVPRIVKGTVQNNSRNQGIERPIDDMLLFRTLLPGESKSTVKKVISFLSSMGFSPELSQGLDYGYLGTPTCVKNMFIDDACFHSTMATALVYLDGLVSEPGGKVLSMRHASCTLGLIQRVVTCRSEISDLTIAAVISMAQYEHQQHRIKEGSVHIYGLLQMTHLRGGIRDLIATNFGLGQKLLRIDLEYALQLGSPTMFNLEDTEIGCVGTTDFAKAYLGIHSVQRPGTSRQCRFDFLSVQLRRLLLYETFFAAVLNDAVAGTSPRVDATEVYQNTVLLGYRLVRIKPLGSPCQLSFIENKAHLGLAAFLQFFLQGWDGKITRNDHLTRSLLAAAHELPGVQQDQQELSLWFFFIGAASSHLWDNPFWISRTTAILYGLNIDSWHGVKTVLAEFPWVNAIHDAPGHKLWCLCDHTDDSAPAHLYL